MSQKRQRSLLSWVKPRGSAEEEKVDRNEPETQTQELSSPLLAAEHQEGAETGKTNQHTSPLTTSHTPCTSKLPLQVGNTPNQPRRLTFPFTSFGNKQRSFQPGWFDRHPWLHYDESRDAAFCHTCIKAVANNMISSGNADVVFTGHGYANWKNATEKKKGFRKHETSASHQEAVARYVTIPQEVGGDVGKLLNDQLAKDKARNRKVLLAILANVRYLARQALPLRGNWNLETTSEENSNFHQLLRLRSQDNCKATAQQALQKSG